MRTIRIFVILLVALAVMFPLFASASETTNTDTNTNNKNTIFSSIFAPVALAAEGVNNLAQEKVKTEDEIRDETLLLRWKSKQEIKWNNLPKESFVINASAYTSAADECGKTDGITSSGLIAKANRTIACPPEFPFGTKIEIEGQGIFVCEDRGGAIKGNHIDIFVNTKTEAFAFGRQNLNAKVVF